MNIDKFDFDGAEDYAFWVTSEDNFSVPVYYNELDKLINFLRLHFPGHFNRTGAGLIEEERARHSSEGYTPDHDKGHASDLVSAAVSYTAFSAVTVHNDLTPEEARANAIIVPPMWPWDLKYWKPTGDPVRDLTKAGSLIAASIDSILEDRKNEN